MSKIGYKIQLGTTVEAGHFLDSQSKKCNWLYNQLLERANELKAQFIASDGRDSAAAKTVYSKTGLRNLVPRLKAENPFLKTVYSSPLKNAALRLTSAITEYQKSRRGERANGHEVEWPHFRKWKKKWFSLLYDEPWKGYKLAGRQLTLSFGQNETGKQYQTVVTLTESLPFDKSQVKQLRITKDIGTFYAVFTVEVESKQKTNIALPSGLKAAYLDPNHKNLAYLVDTLGNGIEIDNMPTLKLIDRRIDEVKSKRDSCLRQSQRVEFGRDDGSVHRHWEPSRRWIRYNDALHRLYRLRREQTKTFLFTLANELYRRYDVLGIGDYTPHGGGLNTGMRRSMNNQSLIGRFKKILAWVAEREGKTFIELSEYKTTKVCHDCSFDVPGGIPTEIRAWDCPKCGTHHLRDENSARNGLARLLEILLPGSGLSFVAAPQKRCTWRAMPSEAVRELAPRGGSGARSYEQRQDELNRGRTPSVSALQPRPELAMFRNVQV